MKREWKPGDVALVPGVGKALVLDDGRWSTQPRGVIHPRKGFEDLYKARPLVVIDPEDREQIERLAQLLHDYDAHLADDPHRESAWVSLTSDALRKYANPKPPKPEEPTGLGAVVEDAEGRRWVQVDAEGGMWLPQDNLHERWRSYYEVDAVHVLSEGVQS